MKLYGIGSWSHDHKGTGHPSNEITYAFLRKGISNDTYLATCSCGATKKHLTYAKRKR